MGRGWGSYPRDSCLRTNDHDKHIIIIRLIIPTFRRTDLKKKKKEMLQRRILYEHHNIIIQCSVVELV